MDTILLPTDLTVQSLLPIHTLAARSHPKPITIMVVHMMEFPTSISDLLFIGRTSHMDCVPGHFSEALEMLRNKYHHDGIQIKFQMSYCSSLRYFKNFIEGNHISELCLLEGYQYATTLPMSADINRYIHKVSTPTFYYKVDEQKLGGFENFSMLLNGSSAAHDKQTGRPALSFN